MRQTGSVTKVIVQECATMMFLPNPAAHSPNARLIDMVASLTPTCQDYRHTRRGSRWYDLETGPMQQALLSAARPDECSTVLELLTDHLEGVV